MAGSKRPRGHLPDLGGGSTNGGAADYGRLVLGSLYAVEQPANTPTPTATQTATASPTPTDGASPTPTVTPITSPSDGQIAGVVFLDSDRDGLQDPGEGGVEGRLVQLNRAARRSRTMSPRAGWPLPFRHRAAGHVANRGQHAAELPGHDGRREPCSGAGRRGQCGRGGFRFGLWIGCDAYRHTLSRLPTHLSTPDLAQRRVSGWTLFAFTIPTGKKRATAKICRSGPARTACVPHQFRRACASGRRWSGAGWPGSCVTAARRSS